MAIVIKNELLCLTGITEEEIVEQLDEMFCILHINDNVYIPLEQWNDDMLCDEFKTVLTDRY